MINVGRYLLLGSVPICLLASCLGPGAGHTLQTVNAPENIASPDAKDVPATLVEVARVIYRLPPWTIAAFTREEWNSYIDAARLLQRAKPGTVESALTDYVRHFGTAFEEGVDAVDEWSKPFILMRVMFDLPQTLELSRPYLQSYPGAGFTTRPVGAQSKSVSHSISYPVMWTNGRPELLAESGGYNGGPYPAAEEYRYCLAHFKFRSLPEADQRLPVQRLVPGTPSTKASDRHGEASDQ